MSKKNRINNDPFNMSHEEAEKTANLINELVKGNKDITIDDIVDDGRFDPDGRISTFTQQIEDFININIIDKNEESTDDSSYEATLSNDSDIKCVNNGFAVDGIKFKNHVNVDKEDSHKVESTIESKIEPKFNKIDIHWNMFFNAAVIDDGVISHYFNLDEIKSFNPFADGNCELMNLVSGDLDDDEAGSIFSELFYYIITKKVPTMIISESEFELGFGIFSKVNSKYVFFKKDSYVLIYTIDKDEYDEFYNLMGLDSDFIPIEVIKAMVNVAKELDKSSLKFTFTQSYLVDVLVDFSHENIDLFIDMVSKDAEFAGHQSFTSSSDVWKRLRVLDFDTFVSSVEDKLKERTLDDEDDEVVPDDIDESSSLDDYPDLSDVIGDNEPVLETEPPRVIEPVKPSTNQNMTIPVFRKKK